jgi:hypothetical protein
MSTASATPPRDYTRTVYRHRLGSSPAKQRKKKDSDQKSSSATASGTWNTPNMIETPLQSMINNQLQKAVLTPVHSMITSSLICKHHISFPSPRDIRFCPRFDHQYLYIVFTLLPTSLFTHSHDIASSVT